MAAMSKEWYEKEIRRYQQMHIEAHQKIVRLESEIANLKRTIERAEINRALIQNVE